MKTCNDKTAEAYVKENCCELCINKDDCERGFIECFTKTAYADGYKNGLEFLNKRLAGLLKSYGFYNIELNATAALIAFHNEYLNITKGYEKQKKINKELVDENEELKEEIWRLKKK